MQSYDWIVIGNGITGAALSYELAKHHGSVLLLEQDLDPQRASRYSYGGIAFWAGTTELMRQLGQEGYARHQVLSDELGMATQLRELDLLLTIAPEADPHKTAAQYASCAIPPQLISTQEACELEPLLNPDSIGAALTVRHGQILPEVAIQAYNQAFQRLGGTCQTQQVTDLVIAEGKVHAVRCGDTVIHAGHVVVCAGGLSRQLCHRSGVSIRQYFTHAEILETSPTGLTLRSLVMPANLQRFSMEADASRPEIDSLWDEPGHQPIPYILDVGATQFLDGRIRIGQISRVVTSLDPVSTAAESEANLRQGVGSVLPALASLPATWGHCLVAFCHDRLPLVGAMPGVEGLTLFVGFSNPMVIVPPLAERLARQTVGATDDLLTQLSPGRFV